jgi:hypothetical protein
MRSRIECNTKPLNCKMMPCGTPRDIGVIYNAMVEEHKLKPIFEMINR